MTEKLESFYKYFPTNPTFENWGFYVVSAGYSKIPKFHPYPPVFHPDHHHFTWENGRILDTWTFVYIHRGKGIFDSGPSGIKAIREGNLFIAFPDAWHRYRPDKSTGWDEYWVEFNGDCARHFIDKSHLNPSEPVLTIADASKVMDLFLNVINISKEEPHGFEYLLSGLAFNVVTLILAEVGCQNSEDKEKANVIRNAKRILIDNLSEQIDLQYLSREFNMSYSLFRKTFKDFTGFSPHQYRLNFRLHRALRLLRFSNLQISQIAKQFGFKSVYYFSELFKKKIGCSPSEYRKNKGKYSQDITSSDDTFKIPK